MICFDWRAAILETCGKLRINVEFWVLSFDGEGKEKLRREEKGKKKMGVFFEKWCDGYSQ